MKLNKIFIGLLCASLLSLSISGCGRTSSDFEFEDDIATIEPTIAPTPEPTEEAETVISDTTNEQSAKSAPGSTSDAIVADDIATADDNDEYVYVGKTGTKYHNQNCKTLKGNGTKVTKSDAVSQGRQPCKVCH